LRLCMFASLICLKPAHPDRRAGSLAHRAMWEG
jgi:hypothetical protein